MGKPSGSFVLTYTPPPGSGGGWSVHFANGVTDEGIAHFAEAVWRAGPRAGWYGGLISDAGFSALSPADTHASHAGWSEYTALFGSVRPAWATGPAAGGVLSSSTPAVFQITASGRVRGAFLASRPAVGTGAGAVIYATGVAAAGRDVLAGGTLSLTYAVRMTPR